MSVGVKPPSGQFCSKSRSDFTMKHHLGRAAGRYAQIAGGASRATCRRSRGRSRIAAACRAQRPRRPGGADTPIWCAHADSGARGGSLTYPCRRRPLLGQPSRPCGCRRARRGRRGAPHYPGVRRWTGLERRHGARCHCVHKPVSGCWKSDRLLDRWGSGQSIELAQVALLQGVCHRDQQSIGKDVDAASPRAAPHKQERP